MNIERNGSEAGHKEKGEEAPWKEIITLNIDILDLLEKMIPALKEGAEGLPNIAVAAALDDNMVDTVPGSSDLLNLHSGLLKNIFDLLQKAEQISPEDYMALQEALKSRATVAAFPFAIMKLLRIRFGSVASMLDGKPKSPNWRNLFGIGRGKRVDMIDQITRPVMENFLYGYLKMLNAAKAAGIDILLIPGGLGSNSVGSQFCSEEDPILQEQILQNIARAALAKAFEYSGYQGKVIVAQLPDQATQMFVAGKIKIHLRNLTNFLDTDSEEFSLEKWKQEHNNQGGEASSALHEYLYIISHYLYINPELFTTDELNTLKNLLDRILTIIKSDYLDGFLETNECNIIWELSALYMAVSFLLTRDLASLNPTTCITTNGDYLQASLEGHGNNIARFVKWRTKNGKLIQLGLNTNVEPDGFDEVGEEEENPEA